MDAVTLNNKKYILFRLDGHCFSKMTKKYFEKPFDNRFSEIMKETALYLFDEFRFQIGFVGSDEISLVWFPLTEEQIKNGSELLHGGRIFKCLSLLAGSASSFFATTCINSKVVIADSYPHFDCRYFEYDTYDEVLSNIKERITFTTKNSRMMYAQHYISSKKLHKLSSFESIKLVKDELNKDYYSDVSVECQQGSIILRKPTEIEREYNGNIIKLIKNLPFTSQDINELNESVE
jgi:tRNA(His) 5'-end guanylyltransferase